MSKARLNVDSGEWNFSFDENSNSISIGFFSNSGRFVSLNNLRFGWNLTSNLHGVDSKEYPEIPEISYESTDQDYISYDNFSVEPETEYRLLVWAENNGQEYSTYVDWTSPALPVVEPTTEYVEEENV